MANNRTEAKSAVTAALVPTLSLAQHIALLNSEINESVVWGKDVIASETESGGNVTIDYSDKDTATVTTAVNLAVSFTNIENGAVKYLAITKQAGNTLTFAGAINSTNFQKYIDVNLTSAPYIVYNKNGVIYARALRETIIEAIKADIDSANLYKFPTAKAVKDAISDLSANDIVSDVLAAARIPVATESAIGALEVATTAEAKALTSNIKTITPLRLADVIAGLLTKIIDIDDWDMNADSTKDVSHSLTLNKIRTINVMIQNDASTEFAPLTMGDVSGIMQGMIFKITSTQIELGRKLNGLFDNAFYEQTPFNRGWVIIDYLP